MSLTINTNLSALSAQRQLSESQSSLVQALERLSSGKRINSAKDDAAGLAISTRIEANIRGANQAARNANDGVSLMQTTESALGQIDESLQRMRELAVQSANATNSADDRLALDQEFKQLLLEIEYVSQSANFNGVNLLDGNFNNQMFQVGGEVGQIIPASIHSFKSQDIGKHVDYEGETSTTLVNGQHAGIDGFTNGSSTIGETIGISESEGQLLKGELVINGTTVEQTEDFSNLPFGFRQSRGALAKAMAINNSNVEGVTAYAESNYSANNDYGISFLGGDDAGDSVSLTINLVEVARITVGEKESYSVQELVTSINLVQEQTGVTASLNEQGGVYLDGKGIRIVSNVRANSDSGSDSDIQIRSLFGDSNAGLSAGTLAVRHITHGKVQLKSNEAIEISGTNPASAGFAAGTYLAQSNSLADANIQSTFNANTAIYTLDQAIDQVSSQRAKLGAAQKRFETNIQNTVDGVVNLEATKSRIVDADYAVETSNLTKSQILQQAGTSILAQANANQQTVLALISSI